MDERLKKYADMSRFFLTKVSSIDECLDEARNTQVLLAELIALQNELQMRYQKLENKFNIWCADKRDAIFQVLNKNSIKASAQVIEDKLMRLNAKEYQEMKDELDEARLNYQAAEAFKMAFFQRKDIINEVVNYWKSKMEINSCIMNNKEFVKRLLERL